MKTVIFQAENAVFKFALKEVKKLLIGPESEYNPDEAFKLLDIISAERNEAILISDDHDYFGYVALDFIGSGKGTAICKLCDKTYAAGQLKEFVVGHGKSPFDINQEQKGGTRQFEKRRNPSLFGGRKFNCPEGHTLISMETWRT
jgi:hypothetical protein